MTDITKTFIEDSRAFLSQDYLPRIESCLEMLTDPVRHFIHSLSLIRQLIKASPILLILSASPASLLSQTKPLPTGVRLDPAGDNIKVGDMPLAMTFVPSGEKLIVSLGGWREQGIQVVDVQSRHVDQTIKQDGAFLGLAFSRDGRTLYASGGNEDSIYCYDWDGKIARLRTRIELAKKDPKQMGTRYPAGLAVSNDGKFLYVAENLADALAVVDLTNLSVVQRLATEHYPYAVNVARDNAVYVSAWGGKSISVFRSQTSGQLFLWTYRCRTASFGDDT